MKGGALEFAVPYYGWSPETALAEDFEPVDRVKLQNSDPLQCAGLGTDNFQTSGVDYVENQVQFFF